MELMVIGLAGYTPEYFHVRIYKLTAPPPTVEFNIYAEDCMGRNGIQEDQNLLFRSM